MNETFLADILLTAGSLIGVTQKLYALKDERTTWNRISSGLNAFTMPITLIYPFYLLQVYISMIIGIINMMIWIGIFIYRKP
ncbi:hypothetical protein OSG_eHP23_00150 [environmental Halophage eHP-23]|nr:hypothetical protein OSG_eHP23_00150 [environmental Halophage eHP-23]